MTKRKKTLFILLGLIIIVFTILLSLNQFYVDYLWFSEMGYTNIFFKEIITKSQIGIPIFAVLGLVLFFYLKFLDGVSSRYLGLGRVKRTKKQNIISISISGIVALMLTIFITNNIWYQVLEFVNRTSFNTTDPLFNQDLSLYFFELPLYQELFSIFIGISIVIAILTFGYTAYTLYREKDIEFSRSQDLDEIKENAKGILKGFFDIASKQIGIFLGVFFIILALGSLMEAFALLYSTSGIVFGAGAADIDVGFKVIVIKGVLCLVLAVTSIIAGFRKKYLLMGAGPVLLIAVIIVGGLVQMGYESFIVIPNQFTKEEKYLTNNIQSTQKAYGLTDVETKEFSTSQEITAAGVNENRVTVQNIPINDLKPTQDMYNSLQGIRNYYKFYDVDVDRYFVNGTYTQVFLGTREMNNTLLPDDAKTWVNLHLKYTHGFGVAVSPVNKTNDVGQPDLIVKDIPPVTDVPELVIDQPRIYFGENDYGYAVTNCTTPEFDYPQGENNQEVVYTGTAGIKMSVINKLAFALYHGAPELLLANEVTSESNMIIHRNIIDRVSTIAPFLSYDNDPYMVISEGKLYWILDAFTASSRYPYSQPFDDAGNNYIRNSVKVVVDAYNGDVTFYQVQDEPILETYGKIFPGFLKDASEMPEGIKQHLRYSKTLFDIQSEIYKTYHMSNPQVFYNKEDQWATANQIYESEKTEVPVQSSYIIMKLPEREAEFMLTVPFTPKDKDNMTAWLAGVSDGAEYGKLILYQFPKQQLVYGPMQIEQRIDQDTVISPQLTLLGQQGSRVLRGNMMTIPIGNAIIYVEPVYIQASSGENNIPEMKKVIVAYENQIVMADSLELALAQIFNTQVANTNVTAPQTTGDNTSVLALTTKANSLFKEAQDAQRVGDWALYGQKLSELEQVLGQLQQITGAATVAAP
ncbi:UPF0182 family protein [Acetobacterium bakii]|uniref:UPF0182 protein AKG39_17195 n=1 Tax=Acetobacterium bakii TaxID=52689 RepID=A0A0L6TW82_9FIRM|nr:UPF0182 family protein [Acetobacterium bakii]KNZ40513.1 hypothetical protein AKG39_17195 [Acetobacterium bakii]